MSRFNVIAGITPNLVEFFFPRFFGLNPTLDRNGVYAIVGLNPDLIDKGFECFWTEYNFSMECDCGYLIYVDLKWSHKISATLPHTISSHTFACPYRIHVHLSAFHTVHNLVTFMLTITELHRDVIILKISIPNDFKGTVQHPLLREELQNTTWLHVRFREGV